MRAVRSCLRAGRPSRLLLARADDDALQRCKQGALPTRSAWIKLDPIIGDDLTAIELRVIRACDLAAEPAFHHTFRITFLAISESWQAVSSDIGHTGNAATDPKAFDAQPDEIAGVETPM